MAPAVGFRGRLAIVALAALAIRTAATIYHRDYPVIGDALTFHLEGGHLAHGEGFRRVFEDVPTAEHPPLFICLLALFTLLGADGFLAQKLLLGLVGTVTVVLVGLLARRVAGDRAGLVAAALAAVYPLLWLADGSLMSESLYGAARSSPCCWRRYAYLDARTVRRAARARRAHRPGGADPRRGAAARAAARPRARRPRRRCRARAARAPRRARGAPSRSCSRRGRSATRRPSTRPCSSPPTARACGSAPTAIRPTTGRSSACGTSPATARRPPGDEAQQSREYRRRGMQYLRDHAGRVPLVLAARVGRLYDVFRPAQMRVYEASEGRPGALGAPRRVDVLAARAARHRRRVAAAPAPPAARDPARRRWPWSRSPRC